jgi:uncharacterized protein (TIGR01777 family)
MRIAISGASGFLGSRLATALRKQQHEVLALVRHPPGGGEVGWDPELGSIEAEKLRGVDAVINLAGENIATRWTPEARRKILDSRVKGTGLLATALARLTPRPTLFLSVSAVGYYGDRGDDLLTERSGPGTGFLADVTQAWEAAAEPARAAGIRVVHPRMGMILDRQGGALAKMLPPFKLGVGGKLGTGKQWMSWVALDDVIAAMHRFLADESLDGPYNIAAPEPVRNREFTRALARELHRPALFTVPRAALHVIYGKEMPDEVLLASAKVIPERLIGAGFAFGYPSIRATFAHLLNPA